MYSEVKMDTEHSQSVIITVKLTKAHVLIYMYCNTEHH